MNILVISHSSVVESYRGKLYHLAGYAHVNLHLILPPRWQEGGRTVQATVGHTGAFQTSIIPAYRLNRVASYFYHPVIFQKKVRTISPSILYVEEEPWSVAAWQALHAARPLNAKLVFFTWENIRKNYKYFSEKILHHVLAESAGAVAGNIEAQSILKDRGFTKSITVCPQYGVDPELFKKTTGEQGQAAALPRPVIAYVGRLEPEKGVHLLIQAAGYMKGAWSLLIVGSGPAKGQLMSLRETLPFRERVVFIDAVPREKIAGYLSHVDLLVLPSISTSTWKEQFGRILIEAMAMGVPVIGSDSGAIPEVIGDAGCIFHEGNVEDLFRKVSSLLENASLRAMYAARGMKRVQERFTEKVLADKLYQYFSEIDHDAA